ncbi:DDE-type integrase/transposase/recombinase [Acidocella sp.]|uniref:DDE-type integrase/transposase/recombinase n=1 Tax=Acidocella sp. TaxID=50710 RepID=UPI0026120FF5|nr:DDE-type integrase/transposase/recombinase [Acidocella sp.]
MFAAEIRKRRVEGMRPRRWHWHLDKVVVETNGERHYLWYAVDHKGEVLESYVTRNRDKQAAKQAALKSVRKSRKRFGHVEKVVADRLASYETARRELSIRDREQTAGWTNNRAENSYQPFRRRKRAMLHFRRMRSLQKFASAHASSFNHFNHGLLICVENWLWSREHRSQQK